APYDCPKSAAILKRARIGKGGSVALCTLASLASQDASPAAAKPFSPPKPDKLVKSVSEWKLSNPMFCTWRDGYTLIADCEQYHRAPSDGLFNGIRSKALNLAAGQDAGGLWGHQLATPERNGRLPGYAQMNQPSLTILIGLLLAQKCGVEDPLLTEAIERTSTYYESYIGRGSMNYGVHGPNEWNFNNNGMSATAAIAMALRGNKEGARFFSKLSAATVNLEQGHAANIFNPFWTPLGAAVAGPEVMSGFFKESRWLYTMYRRWDGTFWFPDKRFDGSALVIPYTLAKRSLLITGRDADESLWLKGQAAREAVAAERTDYAAKGTAELLKLTRHELPQVRIRAIAALNKRDDYKPDIGQWLTKGTKHEKMLAMACLGRAAEAGVPHIDQLAALLRDSGEDVWVRVRAAQALATIGEPARPHYMDLVRFALEERGWDRFGDVDCDLGPAINKLCPIPFSSNLVTDKEVFYAAALKLIRNKRFQVRSHGLSMLREMPRADFPVVADAVMHEARDEDPSYHSYHNKMYVRDAICVLARGRVKEGLQMAQDIGKMPDGKQSFKMQAMYAALASYGAAGRPVVESIRAQKGFDEAGMSRKWKWAWDAMLKQIEADTSGDVGLIPFEQARRPKP
ncbi:MAG: DUF6288 domain-containing protein, partial [Luteolibacter sp.]